MSDYPNVLSPEIIKQLLDNLSAHELALEKKSDELHKAQLELDAARARFIVHYDLAPVGYYTVSKTGTIVQANITAGILFGIELQALTLQKIDRFIFPEDLESYNKFCRAIFELGETQKCELRMLKNDGSPFWAHLVATAAQNIEGTLELRAVLSDITDRKRTQHELEESRTQMRGLAARLVEGQEKERKYIAREIHDELGQLLTGLQLNASIMAHQFAATSPELREHLQKSMVLTNKALHAARNVTSRLRIAALEMGITCALKWLADRFSSNTGIQCEVYAHTEEYENQIEEIYAIALFRIAQESLTNVTRYANARKVEIILDRHTDKYFDDIILKIRDDGIGFDQSIKNANSFGLVGIRERALMLSGTAVIHSQLGKGTEIVVRIPINHNLGKSI